MKLLLPLMALCGLMLPLTGCTESIAQMPHENDVRMQHASILDLKQAPDDIMRMLYIDRPVWLSRYPIPNE